MNSDEQLAERLEAQAPLSEPHEGTSRALNEVAAHEDDADEVSAQPSSSRVQVFISYRVEPDQSIAAALRRLIATAIAPAPNVFVSGEGGLRPSSLGFKPQLQAAVQEAQAFIGVITPASKDREWIYYEAGAAWGRGQLYAPVLVETSPSDLSSSIADYQATHAERRAEMHRLMKVLAETLGARVRKHFAQRYSAFERTLPNRTASVPSDGSGDPVRAALLQKMNGLDAEAAAAFSSLREAAQDLEELARIEIAEVWASQESWAAIADRVEGLPERLHGTFHYKYWCLYLEKRDSIAIAGLEKLLASEQGPVYLRRNAQIELARRCVSSLDLHRGQQVLLAALVSDDRTLRLMAATSWMELRVSEDDPLVSFLISCIGLDAKTDANLLRRALDLAAAQEWPAVRLRLAEVLDGVDSTGASANEVGRALAFIECPSLAYRDFMRAADQGVSVGLCNAASLFRLSQVEAAGLKLMQDHSGPFDSMDEEFPHSTRASLESAVQLERRKAELVRQVGREMCDALTFISELFLTSPSVGDPAEYVAEHALWRVRSADGELQCSLDHSEWRKLSRMRTFNLWIDRLADRSLSSLFSFDRSGEVVGFLLQPSSSNERPRRLRFTRQLAPTGL